MSEENNLEPPGTEVSKPQNEPERPGGLRVLLLIGLALLYSVLCFQIIAVKLYLICFYGWNEVVSRNLHFVEMPKRQTWLVSNGDELSCEWTVYGIGAFFFFTFMGLSTQALERWWPKRQDDTSKESGSQSLK